MTGIRGGVILAALLMATSVARAEVFLATYTGTVQSVPTELSADFAVGDAISGTYTFDTSVAARPGSTSNAAIFDALLSFSIKIGSTYEASFSNPTPGREIQIDHADGVTVLSDRYLVLALASSGLTGPALSNGMVIDSTGPHLDDSTTGISDALILPTSLDLSAFATKIIDVTFTTPGQVVALVDFPFLEGSIDTLTFQPVPEPASLAMLATGACTVIGLGLRRRRKQQAD
ncbi:MAG TPA: PEP-CTERM sorting domain-containing protein [Planctomycetaceae bacterium]|nr:PEP-CTERM sorting domain-containing protein [Planctomycetaceae bacterium]